MSKVVLHPTYAERLWLITAHRDTGIPYKDVPPLLICNAGAPVGWSPPLIRSHGD